MYWTKIRLRSGSTNIDLPLVGATVLDPFIMKNIDGLGPPEVVVSISDTANQGSVYQGRRPRNRQVVARIGLNPNYSIGGNPRTLRDLTYSLLNGAVDMVVMEGTTELCHAHGWVSKMEPVLFTKDPEISITIDCDSPYLQAMTPISVDVGTIDHSTPLIVNPGTAPTGFNFRLVATELTYTFALVNIDELSVFQVFDVSGMLNNLEYLNLNTVAGARDVSKIAGPSTISLLGNIAPGSEWVGLVPGANNFLILNGGKGFNWAYFDFTPNYWGV